MFVRVLVRGTLVHEENGRVWAGGWMWGCGLWTSVEDGDDESCREGRGDWDV